jgi:hypothetical protein
MKKKIKEVQNYFADKLARGLYKVEYVDDEIIKVVVDGEYRFGLWVSGNSTAFSIFSDCFIKLKFTPGQKEIGWKIADKKRRELYADTKEQEEIETLRKLQEKYPDVK